MKKKLIIALVVIITMSFTAPLSVSIRIKGSDTLLPVVQKWAEAYMKLNPETSISVTGGGSGVGIAALIDGYTDIAIASRKIKMDEKLKLQEAGKAYVETIVAYDALSVIVNPANKVKKLTREQLEGIFTGKITNWKDLGGDDFAIVCYSRESSSGTFEFFKEHVLKGKNYSSSCLMMAATGAVVQSVSQTKGAIGYVGLAYVNSTVSDVSVSYDKGTTYVASSLKTAQDKTYPVVRPLYFYYLKTLEAGLKPAMTWVLGTEGQKIVSETGYVPLTAN
ncbi:MAG: PstS family phosphate ABC transporter substrate-binding protein [Bacteroidales bacterium]